MTHLPRVLAALSAVFVTTHGFAQRDPAPGIVNSPYYVKSSEIIGAKVVTGGAAVDAAKQPTLGEVKDLIVDTGRGFGHRALVVLNDGEIYSLARDPAHGISCLRWDESAKKFAIDDTALGMRDTAEATAERDKAEKEKRNAAARPDLEPAMSTRVPSRLMLVSGIKGIKVMPQGSQDSFGKLDDLWVDVRNGAIGFVTVSSGGVLGVGDTTRLVPWQAVSLERSVDRKENQLMVRSPKETLEAAPKVEAKTDINEPTLRANACKHFGCEETWTDKGLHPKLEREKSEKDKMKEKEEEKK